MLAKFPLNGSFVGELGRRCILREHITYHDPNTRLPFYWFFKTLFLLYLAFPFRRTPGIGATRLYDLILYPALSLLDHNVNCARENTAAIVNFVHEGLRTVGQWALAVVREAVRAAIEAANTLPAEPNTGGVVQGGEGAATVIFDKDMPMAGGSSESGPSGLRQRNVGTSDESIEERRRRLEAELAELDELADKLK